jgi:hypothetical protein
MIWLHHVGRHVSYEIAASRYRVPKRADAVSGGAVNGNADDRDVFVICVHFEEKDLVIFMMRQPAVALMLMKLR